MSKSKGRYLQKKEKKPLSKKKIALIALVIVLVLIVAVIIAGVCYYNYILDQIPRADFIEKELSDEDLEKILGYVPEAAETTQPIETTQEPTDPDYGTTGKIVNIMLVGQNYRPGEESKLSDTMILVTVNKETKTMTLTSFQRDLYVQLPNYKTYKCGMQRINVAYNLGWHWGGDAGAFQMLDECIYNNFGVEIDYNVEINFDGFIEIIDMIGGVTVELSEAEAQYLTEDENNEGTFEAGTVLLDGDSALAYARMRHSSPEDNDFHRTSRQRELIGIIVNQMRGLSLTELNKLVQNAIPYVLTDMTNDEITTLMLELLPLLPDLQMEQIQCPAEGTYSGKMVEIYGVSSGVLVPNLEKNREILMAICEEPEETTEPTA